MVVKANPLNSRMEPTRNLIKPKLKPQTLPSIVHFSWSTLEKPTGKKGESRGH